MSRFFVLALVILLLPASGQAGDSKPFVVAHRGASHDAPENTLAAFRLAWEQGADAIEGDFFLTVDGQIVCTHDRTTERLCDQKLTVRDSKLEDLQRLDVGSWKGEKWSGERMPTLEQVLDTVPGGKRIFIEVKCGAEILPELGKAIANCQLGADQITVISFQKEVIAGVKKSMPKLKAFWLTSLKPDKTTGEILPSRATILKTLAETGADGLGCGDHPTLTAEMIDELREGGYETHCWTVDDPQRASQLLAAGVRSITTNRPAIIRPVIADP
jgi:glycerophosphoryl diester phosphodiesterase